MNARQFLATAVLSVCVFFLVPQVANAATLKFDPATVTSGVGEQFTLDVVIDAGADQVLAADVRILYDENLLEVVSISDGPYFQVGKKDSSELGKIYIAAIVLNPAESKTGEGVIASITFRGITDGSGNLTFVCTPGETARDSNIAKDDINATDIIECSANGEADVVIGAGSSVPAPTTAPAGGSSSGGTGGTSGSSGATTLPKSGMLEDLMAFAIPGFLLVLAGFGLKKFVTRY